MRHTYLIGLLLLITGVAVVGFAYPDGVNALLIAIFFSTISILVLRNHAEEKRFVTNLFLAAFFISCEDQIMNDGKNAIAIPERRSTRLFKNILFARK